MPTSQIRRNFFTKIVLPTLLVFILFTISIFSFIIPQFEKNMLDGKREMIGELTNSAWSILFELNHEFEEKKISIEEAKNRAKEQIKYLRYGEENKDYFWITDEHPNMIMHPYRPELDSTDLSEYSDPEGKNLFVEFVKVVKQEEHGYVYYMWQWKDDSTKIVPKLSYVKIFKPWGWIIGTGIYIEDVKLEISYLTNSLLSVALGILFLTGIILTYLGRQSFKIEAERRYAELGLRDSESKYRALVEASTDGLIMILGGKFIYSNNALLEILGYSISEKETPLGEIICKKEFSEIDGVKYFSNLLKNGKSHTQFETKLIAKNNNEVDVILYTSEIKFGDKSGYTIIVKDISKSKRITEELGYNKERFNSLIKNINIGVFRITLGKHGKIIELNQPALKIFGYENYEEIKEIGIVDLFRITEEQDQFFESLHSKSVVKNNVIQIKKKDGTSSIVSISAMVVKDDSANDKYCDGIFEDITERIKIDEERENLIVELQTSLKFLHQPLEGFLRKTVSCNINSSIREAAKIITKQKYSAILVKTEGYEFIGIVTDHDLRKRVIAENEDMNQPIYNVMSSPLIKISINSFVFEALMKMNEHSTRHLAVNDNEGNIIGIISSEELLKVNRQSSAYLLREIEISETVEELSEVKEKLPRLIKTLVDSGAKTKNITKIITSIFDATTNKLIQFAISELGEPPVEYSFVALGSAGRKEQTLISDQDNAIIFEDVEKEKYELTKIYFDKLANYVCDGLDVCGYEYCKGEAMAKNPKWTQPLGTWVSYFHKWISTASQQDLIDISIYFDFRHVCGIPKLVEDLRSELEKLTEGQSGFYQHLTKNCLLHKPPVGIMGKLLLESKGEKADKFDMKMATMPISDFARIYSLKNNLKDTNTLERLQSLFSKGILNKKSYEEIVQAYNFLMQIRFKHQATQLTLETPFDNFISPKELTEIELKTLKNTFSQIVAIQKRLSYDFSGEAI